ncbi:MAG: O-antigen ligase family protein [Desulfomonilaceae bacterium]
MTFTKEPCAQTISPDRRSESAKGTERISVGEGFAVALFLFTCVHAAFLQPYAVIVPGERAKLFTGLLCALSLLIALIFSKNRSNCGTRREVTISIILVVLISMSSLLSSAPQSPSFRGFVVAAAGLGGFWCARLLLTVPARQKLFTWVCTALLSVMVGLGVVGYLGSGAVDRFMDVNPHPLASRMLLLSFAPLTLMLVGNRSLVALGTALLGLTYAVFYLSRLRSAMLIPIALGLAATRFGALSLRRFLWGMLPFSLIILCFFYSLPQWKIGLDYEPAYYRAESYPFSWHIALKHPFLGIGLRSPRDEYLEDYEIRYPYVTKEKFSASVKEIVTSENTLLTFMVDLGFPFFLLYTASVIILLLRLVQAVRLNRQSAFLPPLALLLPIAAGLLHFQVFDGLLHPQVSWFFHILLGLIGTAPDGLADQTNFSLSSPSNPSDRPSV